MTMNNALNASVNPSQRRSPGALSRGEMFVRHIKENAGFHPVLLFGTQAAGKSAVLLSLLAYARYHAEFGVATSYGAQFRKDLYPDQFLADPIGNDGPNQPDSTRFDDSQASSLFTASRLYYENGVPDFNAGLMPGSTKLREPLFIPVNLNKQGSITRFLFIEANGEWYSRDKTSFEYAPFVYEIDCILRYYDRPISVIFTVPVNQQGSAGGNLTFEAVRRCMELYAGHHRETYADNLLLLATQWDTLPNNGLVRGLDHGVSQEEFLEVVERWGAVWAGFIQMQGLRVGSRAAMPYSVGQVTERDGADNKRRPANLYERQSVYTQFPRILWNWLYSNANQDVSKTGARVRQSLFPDVDIDGFPKPSFFTRGISRFYSL